MGLPRHVNVSHDYGTLHIELGAGGGRGDAVLAGACGSNDAAPAHALGQHGLSDGVVDFVGSTVVEVFSLEINLGSFPAAVLVMIGEPLGEV